MKNEDSKYLNKKLTPKQVKIITIVTIILLILILGVVLGMKILKDKEKLKQNNNIDLGISNVQEEPKEEQKEEVKEEKKEIKIFNGDERPIAVMIDNHRGAWPQAGLNDTYLVYEIIVEGGETRLMALFKGQDVKNIGPVRSSRHYFLDYALENDAIYAHYGWSPKAKSDISKLDVDNINGITCSTKSFRRVTTKRAPHNVMTSTSSILSIAKQKGYKTTSEDTSVLNYVADEVELKDGIDATSITIPHSTLHKVKYEYNEKTKRYTRYARGTLQKDYKSGKEITTKNIIIEFVPNSRLNDGTSKDRQNLSNIGTFQGYYITNGKAIKITCKKSARTSKTIYKDSKGNVINVNDGNTWINICPKNAKVNIK